MIPNITILKPAPGDRVHGPFEVRFRALTKDNPKKIGIAVYDVFKANYIVEATFNFIEPNLLGSYAVPMRAYFDSRGQAVIEPNDAVTFVIELEPLRKPGIHSLWMRAWDKGGAATDEQLLAVPVLALFESA